MTSTLYGHSAIGNLKTWNRFERIPKRISDGGVFKNCSLSTALETNQLNIPKAAPLPERINPCPYVIVADDAFPLKPYIMKPFN
jgi:hypothetical protein